VPRFANVEGSTIVDPRFLPRNWEMRLDDSGTPYFISHEFQGSTYVDPRGLPPGWRLIVEQVEQDGLGRACFASDDGGFTTFIDPRGLPDKWELRSFESLVYYLDHANKETTWQDPRADAGPSALQKWLSRDLVEFIHEAMHQFELSRADSERAAAGKLPMALCAAATRGEKGPVLAYLESGGDVNATDASTLGSMLTCAAAGGRIEIVQLLLTMRAQVNLQDRWGCTALATACCRMELQPCRASFFDPDADQTRGVDDETRQRCAVVDMLLEGRADVNLADQLGMTPLIVASIAGEVEIARLLLEAPNVRRGIRDASGQTAFEHASAWNREEVKRLLEASDPVSILVRSTSAQAAAAGDSVEEDERARGGKKSGKKRRGSADIDLAEMVGSLAIAEGVGPSAPPPPRKSAREADAALACAQLEASVQQPQATSVMPSLLCPITMELLLDPVFTCDGHTFERAAIERWLETKNTSPLTGEPLESKRLVPNQMIRSMVREIVETQPHLPECIVFLQRQLEGRVLRAEDTLRRDDSAVERLQRATAEPLPTAPDDFELVHRPDAA